MTRPHPSPGPTPGPTPRQRALFIVLEGIDGSGTTTQLDRLALALRARGRSVHPTREPSRGPIGVLLREILLGQHTDQAGAPVDGRAMALLFAADRRDHLAREIEPALARGSDVISDRYVLSSLAYQAVEAERAWVERLAEGIRAPDLTLFLDTPIDVSAERRRLADRPSERYDADLMLDQVARNYRRLARDDQRYGKVVIIDGSDSVENVGRAIDAAVDHLIRDLEGAT
jgi:dTMP kinase